MRSQVEGVVRGGGQVHFRIDFESRINVKITFHYLNNASNLILFNTCIEIDIMGSFVT